MDRAQAIELIETNAYQNWTEDGFDYDLMESNRLRLGEAICEHGLETDCQPVTSIQVQYMKQERKRVAATGQCKNGCDKLTVVNGKQLCRFTRRPCPNSNPKFLAAKELVKLI